MQKPVANSVIVLREEADDWAILFNPDDGMTFVLNPVSVFIWKHLDGRHTCTDIVEKLHRECRGVPGHAGDAVGRFVQELVEKGYAGYEEGPV